MWISNTATTAMMFPIGLSIVAHLTEGRESETGSREFAIAMMLIAAFAASIGGIGTPIGTPPNLIGIGMLNRIAGVKISFFQWMLLGVPIVVLLFGFLIAYFYFRSLRGLTLDMSRTSRIRDELQRLGPASVGQRNVLAGVRRDRGAVAASRACSRLSGLGRRPSRGDMRAAVPESVAAMIGAILLFLSAGHLARAEVHHDAGKKRSASTGESSCCSAAVWRWENWRSRPVWRSRWARASPPGCRTSRSSR